MNKSQKIQSVKKSLEFVALVARLRMLNEFEDGTGDADDASDTLDDLIASARAIVNPSACLAHFSPQPCPICKVSQ